MSSAAPVSVVSDVDNDPLAKDIHDPELMEQALELFAHMSAEERDETMKELKEILGDDPEALIAFEQIMRETPKMTVQVILKSLKKMESKDEVASLATDEALKLLRSESWDTIWEKRSEILEELSASGKINETDAARFRSNPDAWEAELKYVLNELKEISNALMMKQAEVNGNSEL